MIQNPSTPHPGFFTVPVYTTVSHRVQKHRSKSMTVLGTILLLTYVVHIPQILVIHEPTITMVHYARIIITIVRDIGTVSISII